jgi:hypothetical protein
MSEPLPPPEPGLIEIRVEKLAQLFHGLDPYPFREKDLDKDAEEFIVSWARDTAVRRSANSRFEPPRGRFLCYPPLLRTKSMFVDRAKHWRQSGKFPGFGGRGPACGARCRSS